MTDSRETISPSLRHLLIAQFFGATNDNLLKVLTGLLALQVVSSSENSGLLEFVMSGVMFVLPYLIFAPAAGGVADRFSKTRVIQGAKLVEVIVMMWATVCLHYHSVHGLLIGLFLIGVHSTFFSPPKYGILPEILPASQLSRGNGYIELATFIGCIVGTAIVGPLKQLFADRLEFCGLLMLVFAVIGFLSSLRMELTRPANPAAEISWNSLKVFGTIRKIAEDRYLMLILLANGYFWSVAAFYQQDILLYARNLAHLDDTRTSLLLGVLGIGIGTGSVFAGRVSAGKVELGLVPLGAFGMALASFLLPLTPGSFFLTTGVLVLLGISSGCFIVPLNAYFQHESPEDRRGSYLAASNFIAYLGMLIAYGYIYGGTAGLGMTPTALMGFVGLSSLCVLIFLCKLMPAMLLRCINWLVAHTLYSMKVSGAERIPETGGALIICNHVAYVDPPLLLAATTRPIRFIMYRGIYNARLIKPFARAMQAIPISATDGPREMVRTLEIAREALRNGELVCIFAEGEVTRIGHMLGFKRGFERIVKGLDVPIIPAYIDQIWGSIFSNRGGRFFWKWPRQIPYPVALAFGEPLSPRVGASAVRQSIQELAAELAMGRRNRYPSLAAAFVRQVKRHPFRQAVSDTSGKRLSYGQLLLGVLALRRVLRSHIGDSKMVGVLLPPSVGGVMTNLALTMGDRVPVNLNFTSGADSLRYALDKCEITRVITSRAFLEKTEIENLPGVLYLDDMLVAPSRGQAIKDALLVALFPANFFCRRVLGCGAGKHSLATVIFSSGSTAEPKGVMLSHGNIMSNVESIGELFQLDSRDGMVGILPLFHSFGFTASMWLPLLSGIRVGYHPNPTEAAAIGELVQKEKLTILMSTPTFLLSYIRKCTPEQFRSLRLVVTGAEKLKERIADSFAERFGPRPMEGYGATELSPVAAFNVPDFEDTTAHQTGNKPGTVGRPVPGVAVRIVDAESFELVEPGSEGLLLVRGPNVMLGYLKDDARTAQAIRDGWYVTGDLATMDDDGFITITDRLSRFSKIAGEMVPHGKVEEAIHSVLAVTDVVCAVTGIPDEKKGERLVALITTDIDAADLVKRLSELGLPNLWIPKRDAFVRVDALPYLGTGKLDLKQIKVLATSLVAGEAS